MWVGGGGSRNSGHSTIMACEETERNVVVVCVMVRREGEGYWWALAPSAHITGEGCMGGYRCENTRCPQERGGRLGCDGGGGQPKEGVVRLMTRIELGGLLLWRA